MSHWWSAPRRRCFLRAPSAHAHATLESSTPVDGSRVEVAPAEVILTFDEAVQLVRGTAQVISDDGARVDSGGAHLSTNGTSVVIPLQPHLAKGSYTATWRVVSADTHVVAGSISFGVGQDAHVLPSRVVDPSRTLTVADDVVQGVVVPGFGYVLGHYVRVRNHLALGDDVGAYPRGDLDRVGADRLRDDRTVSAQRRAAPGTGLGTDHRVRRAVGDRAQPHWCGSHRARRDSGVARGSDDATSSSAPSPHPRNPTGLE